MNTFYFRSQVFNATSEMWWIFNVLSKRLSDKVLCMCEYTISTTVFVELYWSNWKHAHQKGKIVYYNYIHVNSTIRAVVAKFTLFTIIVSM